MRYESKNKYFKSIAVTLGNFINVEKTVATRHQRFMCYKMECTNFLGGDSGYGCGTCYQPGMQAFTFIILTVISTSVSDLPYKDTLVQICPRIRFDSTVHRYIGGTFNDEMRIHQK